MIFGHAVLGDAALAEVLSLTLAWEAMKRRASSVSDISRLNRATGLRG